MRVLLLGVALAVLTGCPAAVCTQLQTRCSGEVAQVCDARGRWQNVMDCAATEPGEWYCAEDDEEGHTCLTRQ